MISRRSEMEIRASILLQALEEIKPTVLMYRTNISWQPLMRHVAVLSEKGLIRERSTLNNGRKRDRRTTVTLRTTQSGLKAVRDINKCLKLFQMPLIEG